MAFLDTQFPTDISYGAQGGPKYSTTITRRLSGREIRNQNWTYPLHEYNIATAIKSMSDLDSVIAFFHNTNGSTNGFRFKDWADFKTTSFLTTTGAADMPLGTYSGSGTTQLYKTYTTGAYTKTRNITKPIANTVRITVNSSEQSSPTWSYPWTLDDATGIITWTGTKPTGLAVEWGGQFDVPCRFADDSLETNLQSYNIGMASLKIIEIRI